jgi:acyl-coenzyme A thioesterase PaaI-like protein
VPDPAPVFVSPARTRLATATRRLVDGVLTAGDAGENELERAADEIERIADLLHGVGTGRETAPRAERPAEDYLPRSPVVGQVSPLAPPLAHESRDGRLHAHGVLGRAYEGPPGYVHGGWIALIFDEVLGMANIAAGYRGMTARLTIRYRRPTPLHTPLHFEGWVGRMEGRRIVTHGTVHTGTALTAEAEGLFVMIDAERVLEYFGERRQAPEPVDPLP